MKFLDSVSMVLSMEILPVRLLASVLGLLNSFSRALGQVVRLMTRSLYACLKPAYNKEELGWDSDTFLSEEAKKELVFWIGNISNLNGFAISPKFPSITTCRVNAGDASGVGLYVAEFTSVRRTIATRRFLD